jgi:hypothetical protein
MPRPARSNLSELPAAGSVPSTLEYPAYPRVPSGRRLRCRRLRRGRVQSSERRCKIESRRSNTHVTAARTVQTMRLESEKKSLVQVGRVGGAPPWSWSCLWAKAIGLPRASWRRTRTHAMRACRGGAGRGGIAVVCVFSARRGGRVRARAHEGAQAQVRALAITARKTVAGPRSAIGLDWMGPEAPFGHSARARSCLLRTELSSHAGGNGGCG